MNTKDPWKDPLKGNHPPQHDYSIITSTATNPSTTSVQSGTSSDGGTSVASNETDALSIKLRYLMMESMKSQNALQDWDTKQELPRNHSPCMMKSNLSRRQLQEGGLLKTYRGEFIIDATRKISTDKNLKTRRRNTCLP